MTPTTITWPGSCGRIGTGWARWLERPRTDFTRLAAQQFRTDPSLEAAFLHGYGPDPREPAAWRRTRICEAIGTAVWAFQVGDERFEQQGYRMIAQAPADDGAPGLRRFRRFAGSLEPRAGDS